MGGGIDVEYQDRKSLWTGKMLHAYIRRDRKVRHTLPALLNHILSYRSNIPIFEPAPIDYVYFERRHLGQVNRLLCAKFWAGIDVSENLSWPDFTIVALYKKLVVGCAFMSPECYITYFTVRDRWQQAGIGKFMLFHLIKCAGSRDITLHVSVDNPAMLLYQKFGFKTEKFITGFYADYLPADSSSSRNACYMRLRSRILIKD